MLPTEREHEHVPPPPPPRDDAIFASRKITYFRYAIAAIFIFLLTAFWELQVSNPEFYTQRAERNHIKAIPILAPRGKILDRDGRIIVDNQSSFSLMLSRESLKPEHLEAISEGLNLDHNELVERVRQFDRTRPNMSPSSSKKS